MAVYIDNTGILRVTSAKITALDGTTEMLSASGSFTIYECDGAEVAGQTWPTALTLNSPGNYAGVIESDVEFISGSYYKAVVTIGTEPNSRAVFNVGVHPVERASD